MPRPFTARVPAARMPVARVPAARMLAALAGAALWAWPIAPPHPVVGPWVAPSTRYSAGHRGIDIGAPVGAAVLAPADGVVHFAGWVVDRPVLSLAHPGGVLSSFEPVTTELTRGTAVARGQVIGRLLPGHCASPCLHLGVRVDGEYVSPLAFLGGVPRAVLLPMGAPAPADTALPPSRTRGYGVRVRSASGRTGSREGGITWPSSSCLRPHPSPRSPRSPPSAEPSAVASEPEHPP